MAKEEERAPSASDIKQDGRERSEGPLKPRTLR